MACIQTAKPMNEEAQRIAIAEACGWRLEWQDKFAKTDSNRQLLHLLRPNGEIEIAGYFERSQLEALRRDMARYIPNYLNDLNAMHEAEKTLRIGVDLHIGQRWFGYLANVVSGKQMYLNEYDWPGAAYFICRATAKQRAEAFLRTIGKWEDGK